MPCRATNTDPFEPPRVSQEVSDGIDANVQTDGSWWSPITWFLVESRGAGSVDARHGTVVGKSEPTTRGLLDCLIAAVAWRHEAALLAYDVDLARMAAVGGAPLDPASIGP